MNSKNHIFKFKKKSNLFFHIKNLENITKCILRKIIFHFQKINLKFSSLNEFSFNLKICLLYSICIYMKTLGFES